MGFYTSHASIQGSTKYESDALPTEPLGLNLRQILEPNNPVNIKTNQLGHLPKSFKFFQNDNKSKVEIDGNIVIILKYKL